jgi:hypothetical protein
MLANTTSKGLRLTIRDFWQTKEEQVSISLPTGTASAVINVDDEWIGIDVSQVWFWGEEWQARYKLAISELDSGDYVEFDNGDDFIASLDNLENE